MRPSRCRSRTGWCRSTTVDVLVATHAQRHRPAKETKALTRKVTAAAASTAAGDGRPERDPQGRLIRQRQLRRRRRYRVGKRTSAARSKSRSSATPSRSPPAARSCACTRSATTAPASTAPSPTPAADPHAPTPPNPSPEWNTATGANPEHGYRDLTVNGLRRLVVNIVRRCRFSGAHAGDEVLVGGHGEAGMGMAKSFRDNLDRRTRGDEQTRVGMAQVVEADSGDAGAGQMPAGDSSAPVVHGDDDTRATAGRGDDRVRPKSSAVQGLVDSAVEYIVCDRRLDCSDDSTPDLPPQSGGRKVPLENAHGALVGEAVDGETKEPLSRLGRVRGE